MPRGLQQASCAVDEPYALVEKTPNADVLRELTGFVAERLIKLAWGGTMTDDHSARQSHHGQRGPIGTGESPGNLRGDSGFAWVPDPRPGQRMTFPEDAVLYFQ